jgi:hypothetical protein
VLGLLRLNWTWAIPRPGCRQLFSTIVDLDALTASVTDSGGGGLAVGVGTGDGLALAAAAGLPDAGAPVGGADEVPGLPADELAGRPDADGDGASGEPLGAGELQPASATTSATRTPVFCTGRC